MGKLGQVDLGRIATYQDLLDAPENAVAEIIDGALYTQPRPRVRHGRFHTRLLGVLTGAFEDGLGSQGGWVLIVEPELHLGEDIMVPDIAAWRADRFPGGVDDDVGIRVSPDWVCELLSPSTAVKDRVVKLPRYGEHGVRWAWIVDASLETIEVYRHDDRSWILTNSVHGEASVALPPFETCELPLRRLFQAPAHEP